MGQSRELLGDRRRHASPVNLLAQAKTTGSRIQRLSLRGMATTSAEPARTNVAKSTICSTKLQHQEQGSARPRGSGSQLARSDGQQMWTQTSSRAERHPRSRYRNSFVKREPELDNFRALRFRNQRALLRDFWQRTVHPSQTSSDRCRHRHPACVPTGPAAFTVATPEHGSSPRPACAVRGADPRVSEPQPQSGLLVVPARRCGRRLLANDCGVVPTMTECICECRATPGSDCRSVRIGHGSDRLGGEHHRFDG